MDEEAYNIKEQSKNTFSSISSPICSASGESWKRQAFFFFFFFFFKGPQWQQRLSVSVALPVPCRRDTPNGPC